MGQAAEVIVEELVLALVGLSAGAAVAGGLFSFIVELGVIADFADRTHTGDKLLFYETCVALGGIIGNIVFLFYSFAPNAVSFASASFASGAVTFMQLIQVHCLGFLPGFLSDAGRWRLRRY